MFFWITIIFLLRISCILNEYKIFDRFVIQYRRIVCKLFNSINEINLVMILISITRTFKSTRIEIEFFITL